MIILDDLLIGIIVIYIMCGFIFHGRIATIYKHNRKHWPILVIHIQITFWWLPILIWNIKNIKNITKYQSKTERYKPLFENTNKELKNEKNT